MIANPKQTIVTQKDRMNAPTSSSIGALGNRRLFADPAYHFQALRVLNEVANDGADVTECLETIGLIHGGDASGWYDAWATTAKRNVARAEGARDQISKGLAYLRAHNYWRTAEFLLKPDDLRRPPAWTSQVDAFDRGLEALGIAHERTSVPYEKGALRAIFYPGPAGWETKPLIVFVGGEDSTLEELYFVLVPAAYRRGYGVLTYEGPGQGAALREHGLYFSPEWEKPNAAVFDAYLGTHAKPPSIVLIGMSMGGYLAPRAAAFESRIDGVVSFDVLYDLADIVRHFVTLARDPATSASPSVSGTIDSVRWTFGARTLEELLDRTSAYRLADVAVQISCDVLVLAGTEDEFVPVAQVAEYVAALTGARSVEKAIYDRASGGAEHCQEGASTLWHETFFDWLLRRFPGLPSSP
jgi:alpha-beta hydrolase superfamily lysophospholipase